MNYWSINKIFYLNKEKSSERITTLNKVKYVAKNLFTKSISTSKKTKSCIKKKIVKKIPKDLPIIMPTIEFNELEHQYLYDFDLAFRPSAKLNGKVTEAMNKQGINGYEWTLKPEPASIPTFEFFSDAPKLTSVVDSCEKAIDSFNNLFSDEMVDYICLHSNEKLVREKIRKPSINFFVFVPTCVDYLIFSRNMYRINSLRIFFPFFKEMDDCSSLPITNIEIRAYVGLLILF
jgi:hypothetical protein